MRQITAEVTSPAQQSPRPLGAQEINLVLAEAYPLLLEGMQQAFNTGEFRVVAACSDGESAIRAVKRHEADVLVIDLDIEGGALKFMHALAVEALPTRVVLLAGSLGESVMLEALRLGVRGVVLKSMPRHLLLQCVRKVHGGGTWVEKVAMGRAVEQLLRHTEGQLDAASTLSPRELDILRIVVEGWSNKEIADKLSISEGTVKAHLHHIYEKLGVRGRLELTLYARDKGLLSPFMARTPLMRRRV